VVLVGDVDREDLGRLRAGGDARSGDLGLLGLGAVALRLRLRLRGDARLLEFLTQLFVGLGHFLLLSVLDCRRTIAATHTSCTLEFWLQHFQYARLCGVYIQPPVLSTTGSEPGRSSSPAGTTSTRTTGTTASPTSRSMNTSRSPCFESASSNATFRSR